MKEVKVIAPSLYLARAETIEELNEILGWFKENFKITLEDPCVNTEFSVEIRVSRGGKK